MYTNVIHVEFSFRTHFIPSPAIRLDISSQLCRKKGQALFDLPMIPHGVCEPKTLPPVWFNGTSSKLWLVLRLGIHSLLFVRCID